MKPEHTDPTTPDLPSGPWRCRWVQGRRREREDVALRVHRGTLTGGGIDADGVFTYVGRQDGLRVELVKVYDLPRIPVPARLTYTGTWNGTVIAGEWVDDAAPWNRGPFQMWPGHGPAPARKRQRAQDLPKVVPVRSREVGHG